MYHMPRTDDEYIDEVRKFVAAAKSHRESQNQTLTICPCSRCKNLKAAKDSLVRSHLVMFGFVKDYTVWTSHGEKEDDASGGIASGMNLLSSTTRAVPMDPRPDTAAAAGVQDGEDVAESTADGDDDDGGGGGDGEQEPILQEPEDVQRF